MMDPKEAWRELEKLFSAHEGTGGTQRLEDLVLSLYNGEDYPCDLGGVIGGLDERGLELVLELLKDYHKRGESDELLRIGRRLAEGRLAARRSALGAGS